MKTTTAQQNKKRPLIINESLEILKDVQEQIGLTPAPKEPENSQKPTQEEQIMKAKDEAQGQRNIEILNREIKDMQTNKQIEKQQELQKELAAKQVAIEKPAPMSIAKKGRRMLGAIAGKFKRGKQNPEDNQKFVETRKPPSS